MLLITGPQKVAAHYNYVYGGPYNYAPGAGICPGSFGGLQTAWPIGPTQTNFNITQGQSAVATVVVEVHVCDLAGYDAVYGPHYEFYNGSGNLSGWPITGHTGGPGWDFPDTCRGCTYTNTFNINLSAAGLPLGLNELCWQMTAWGWYENVGWQSDTWTQQGINWHCFHVNVLAPPPTPAVIYGRVWNDANGNGIVDEPSSNYVQNGASCGAYTNAGASVTISGIATVNPAAPNCNPQPFWSHTNILSFGSRNVNVNVPVGWQVTSVNNNPATLINCSIVNTSTVSCNFQPGSSHNVYFGIRPAPAQPDYVISAVSHSPTPTTGISVSFSGTVRNQTTTGTATPSKTRLEIDLGNNNTYDITISPDQDTSGLAGLNTETENWTNVWTAVVGTHKYRVCADALNSIVESNEANNCTVSPPFTVASPPAPATPAISITCVAGAAQATITWNGTPGPVGSGSALGFFVDLTPDNTFATNYNQWNPESAAGSFSTVGPSGDVNGPFRSYPSGSPNMPALAAGTTYYTRIYNGSHSGVASAVAPGCITPSCGSVTPSIAIPEPGETFSITFNFTLSAPVGSNTGYSVTMTLNGLSTSGANPVAGTVLAGQSGGSVVFNGVSGASAGQYGPTFTVSGGFSISNCPGTISIANKPYMRVYGGDVLAGTGFGSCTPTTDSGIVTYNQAAAPWGGAGTQFAAQATGAVYQFASAAMRNGSSPGPPAGLSFANTTNAPWGGSFGTAPCVPDYFGTAVATGGPGSTYGPVSIPNSDHRVLVRDGNLTITGNVTYAGAGNNTWTTATIPSLYIIVRGDIYISSTVTQLDGVYIAQPNGASGGKIYTCTNAGALWTAANLSANCGSKLTVNGAFIAKQVKFLRTSGTLRTSGNNEGSGSANIAEVFNFSPELWLVNPGVLPLPPSIVDSITSLPPVL